MSSSIHTNGGTGEAQPEAGAEHKEEVAIAIEGFHIYIKTRHDKEDAQAKKQAKLSIATAVFAFIAAVTTAFAASFTWESLGYASDAVKASQDAAAFSRIAASEAVTQTRIQALANRPYLIFDVVDVHVDYAAAEAGQMAYWYVTFNYKFTNQGNIPALIMSNARDAEYTTSIFQFDGMYDNWIPADIEANKGRGFEVVKANGGVTETFLADRHVPDLGGFHGPAREGQTQLYFGGTVIEPV